jgi:hypothetical protein
MAWDSATSKTSWAGDSLRTVDRRGVAVDVQVGRAQPAGSPADRRLAGDAVQPGQPARRLGQEEQVAAPDLAPVDPPAQQRLVRDDGAVGQRDDRLVDGPQLGVGEDPDLHGHAAARQLDGQRGCGEQPRGQRDGILGRVGRHPHGLGLGHRQLQGQPLQQPLKPATVGLGVDDLEQPRIRVDVQAEGAGDPGDGR